MKSCPLLRVSNGLLVLAGLNALESSCHLIILCSMDKMSRSRCRCYLRLTWNTTKVSSFVMRRPFEHGLIAGVGTILINPGGPGESGTTFMNEWGRYLSKIVGPEFDILGFDPRGIGATTPRASCFESESQEKLWAIQDGPLLNTSDTSIPLARSRQRVLSDLCHRAMGTDVKDNMDGTIGNLRIGRFMGTASVATDMLHISEKLGQEKLQYWGFVSHK